MKRVAFGDAFGVGVAALGMVEHAHGDVFGDGLSENEEDFAVRHADWPGVERERIACNRQVHGDRVGKRAAYFLERAVEMGLIGRAAILLEGLFCDEDRRQFAFAELHGGKG